MQRKCVSSAESRQREDVLRAAVYGWAVGGPVLILMMLFSTYMAGSAHASDVKLVAAEDFNSPQLWDSLESRHGERGVVRILDEATLEVSKKGHVTLSRHILDAVIDPERAEHYTERTVPYSSAFGWNLQRLTARTINRDGSVFDVSERDKDIHSVAEEFVLYAEDKELSFSYPNVRAHSLLETVYTLTTKSPFWRYAHMLGNLDVPILHSRLEVEFHGTGRAAETRGIIWRPRGQVPSPKKIFEKDKTILTWAADDIAAITAESYLPPADYWWPRVVITPGGSRASAREFGVWYWKKLFSKRVVPSDALIDKAKSLVSACKSESEIVKNLFEYVQRFRYVAIYLDKGGWQPHFVDDIDEAGYGDCKDKAALLVGLLRAVDIPAFPALVLSWEHGRVDPDVSDPGHFNHMIVFAEGEERSYWLDPTSRFCPFGMLPFTEQGVTAMVLREDGGILTETPLRDLTGIEDRSRISLQLTDHGTITARVSARYEFPVSMMMRDACAQAGPSGVQRALKSAWSEQNPEVRIDSLFTHDPHVPDTSFALNYVVTIPATGREKRFALAVPVERVLIPRTLPVFGAKERTHPIWIRGQHGFADTLEIQDFDLRFYILPDAETSIEGLPGTFEIMTWREGNRLMWVRKLRLTRKEFEASEYSLIREFFDDVTLFTARYNLVGKGTQR